MVKNFETSFPGWSLDIPIRLIRVFSFSDGLTTRLSPVKSESGAGEKSLEYSHAVAILAIGNFV